MEEKGMEENGRQSRDQKVNTEGRLLVDFIEKRRWIILDGNAKRDQGGKYTFTGKVGCTVIKYIIKDKETKEWVKEVRVGDKIDLDHQPVEVIIREREKKKETRRKGKFLEESMG